MGVRTSPDGGTRSAVDFTSGSLVASVFIRVYPLFNCIVHVLAGLPFRASAFGLLSGFGAFGLRTSLSLGRAAALQICPERSSYSSMAFTYYSDRSISEAEFIDVLRRSTLA